MIDFKGFNYCIATGIFFFSRKKTFFDVRARICPAILPRSSIATLTMQGFQTADPLQVLAVVPP
jgi:hypothetical protein